jgi:uncharacterized lipoprotein YajG
VEWILINAILEKEMKKVFVCAVLFTGLAAQANAMEEAPVISFSDLDINNNGVLSVAEAGNLPDISEQWNSLDLNGDGQCRAIILCQ